MMLSGTGTWEVGSAVNLLECGKDGSAYLRQTIQNLRSHERISMRDDHQVQCTRTSIMSAVWRPTDTAAYSE